MGLPISRSIIESHGGRLWVEEDSLYGCIFHFTLPSLRAREQKNAKPELFRAKAVINLELKEA